MVQERPAAHQPPSLIYSLVWQTRAQRSLGPAPCQPCWAALQAGLRWGENRGQAHSRCICRQGVAPAQLEAAPLVGVQPGGGALRRQRQVCPGSWCRWVNQMPIPGQLWRTIRSTPRKEAAGWEPREKTRPGPKKDTRGSRAAGREGCGCRGPLGLSKHGHHSPPPARNWDCPGRHLQTRTRASVPISIRPKDAAFPEEKQAEGGERQVSYKAGLRVLSRVHGLTRH